jgi:putative ABC transport system ATP-binding protein
MPAPALEITDLTRTFRSGCGEVRALDGVSARFDPGTWTAIMGPSGSGKSTLLLCASGLEAATSGGVRLAEVRAALADVGLGDRARHLPDQLSGGEQQRVAVARALLTRPAVVFADEPTGALDRAATGRVLDLFRLAVDRGACLVCVTHDPMVAERADRVLYLLDGRLVAQDAGASAAAIAARLAGLDAGVPA